MSTSPERVLPPVLAPLRDGSRAVLRPVPYADPVARLLVDRVQEEYVARYGGPDAAEVEEGEFSAPRGLFLVAEVDGVPAGCGAWRVHAPGPPSTVEIKRMYVEPAFRGRGLADVLLGELERSAADAGHGAVVLNSGPRQPEALALYATAGYRTVPAYGVYADSPCSVFLGKPLRGEEAPWAS